MSLTIERVLSFQSITTSVRYCQNQLQYLDSESIKELKAFGLIDCAREDLAKHHQVFSIEVEKYLTMVRSIHWYQFFTVQKQLDELLAATRRLKLALSVSTSIWMSPLDKTDLIDLQTALPRIHEMEDGLRQLEWAIQDIILGDTGLLYRYIYLYPVWIFPLMGLLLALSTFVLS